MTSRPYMMLVHVEHDRIDEVHDFLAAMDTGRLAVTDFLAFQKGHDLALFFKSDSDHPARALFETGAGAQLQRLLSEDTSLSGGPENLVAIDTRLAGEPGSTAR